MSETKTAWTPGPWAANSRGLIHRDGNRWNFIRFPSPWQEDAWTDDELTPEIAANARLMAAAPDLYEALSRLVEEYRYGEWQSSIIDKADAALAKARGEAP